MLFAPCVYLLVKIPTINNVNEIMAVDFMCGSAFGSMLTFYRKLRFRVGKRGISLFEIAYVIFVILKSHDVSVIFS